MASPAHIPTRVKLCTLCLVSCVMCNGLSLCVKFISPYFPFPTAPLREVVDMLYNTLYHWSTFPGYKEFHPQLHMQTDFIF